MIHDVDESLRALVKRDALNGSGVDVAFDAPTKDWVARRNAPVVDLYLYDIREDTSRRETAWEDVRDETGRVTGRRLPPRRYKLSYLVTAWTNRPEDEHRLLSSLLACFVAHEYMPGDLLTGSLEDEEMPILITVALPKAVEDRSIADVWSQMGQELKPSLDLVVTAPMVIDRQQPAGPPVLEQPRLSVVARAADTAQVGSGSAKRGKASAAPRAPAAIAAVDAEGADETVVAGASDQPGRHIRVRQLNRR
jgi:hypothetical protein